MVQKNNLNNYAIVICGPTGSGKSDLAIKLAQILNTEIISADSIAIYKELNIGTAKPTKAEQALVKHHLIDCVEPNDSFTVSDYENMASSVVKKLFDENKVPIICGGTGFYIKSLLYDLSYGNCGKNDAVRQKYQEILDNYGAEYLYEILTKLDPETAKKLHPNDTMRVIRALEIFETSGVKKSSIIDDNKPKFKFFAFSYDYERSVLYDRINRRVDKMFEIGLLDEVKGLIKGGLTLENQSMQGIGYKEFFEFNDIDSNLQEIKENIKQNSRRYAKRQITFFKKLENLTYLTDFDTESAIKSVFKVINNGDN